MHIKHIGNRPMNRLIYYLKNPQNFVIAVLERCGKWIPDELYIRLVYRLHTGYRLHLNPPITFNEKLQWLKLNDRKPLYTSLVDKYEVKTYVASLIGDEYVIPTLGVWNTPDEIIFDNLPETFVLKTTHDGGSEGVIICKKETLNVEKIKKQLRKSFKHNIYKTLREWPYKNLKPRIIAEAYIQQSNERGGGLDDYKFFCFNGEPQFCQVKTRDGGSYTDMFSLEWELLPFNGLNPLHPHAKKIPPKPANLELMISLVKKICEIAPFVRVDFYNVEGKIYFGEITFYPASGMGKFTPQDYDRIVGDMLKLN